MVIIGSMLHHTLLAAAKSPLSNTTVCTPCELKEPHEPIKKTVVKTRMMHMKYSITPDIRPETEPKLTAASAACTSKN